MKLIISSLLAASLLSSCALLTKSKDERTYYALRSSSTTPIASKPSLEAHVRSVSIPGYLDRTQLVSRTTANKVEVLDRHLWAESLDKEIARNIAASLRHLLGSSQIVALDSELAPRSTGLKIDIEITSFELDQQDRVVLDGLYLVANRNNTGKGRNQAFRFTAPVAIATDKKAAVIAAMNTCLDELSMDIARTLARRG